MLSPLMGLLTLANPEARHAPVLGDWYHFWFLIALLLYSGLAYWLHRLDVRYNIFARLEAAIVRPSLWQLRSLLGVAAVTSILMTLTGHAIAKFSPPDYMSTIMQARLILGYAPLFLAGFALSRCAALLDAVTSDIRLPLAIVSAIMCAYAIWHLGLGPLGLVSELAIVEVPLTNFGAALCPPAASALILRSSLRIRHVPRLVRNISDASFTMYLLHLPFIFVGHLALSALVWHPWLEFGVVVTASGVISYGFHRILVRRSALLSLLLNGRHRCALALERDKAAGHLGAIPAST